MNQLSLVLLALLLAVPASAQDNDIPCEYPGADMLLYAPTGRVEACTPRYTGPWHEAAGNIYCDLTVESDPAVRRSGLSPGEAFMFPETPGKRGLLPCLLDCRLPDSPEDREPWLGQCEFPPEEDEPLPPPFPGPEPSLVVKIIEHGNPRADCEALGLLIEKTVLLKDGTLRSRCSNRKEK